MKQPYVTCAVLVAIACLASQHARAADVEIEVDDEVLEQTRRILERLPAVDFEGARYLNPHTSDDEIASEWADLVALLPVSGDALISIAARRDDPARELAIQMLAKVREKLSLTQIEKLIHAQATAIAEGESHYPKGVESYVHTGYKGIGAIEGATIRTNSYKLLDGVRHGDPFEYEGPQASTGGVSVAELGYGIHTVQAITEYEVTYRGKTIAGKAESPVVAFEIIQDITPNTRVAPMDRDLAKLVRRACRFVEVREPNPDPNFAMLPPEEPWRPNGTAKKRGSPDSYGYHTPLFVVSEPLPVDLCFEVEIRIVGKDDNFVGDPLVVPKGKTGQFTLDLRNPYAFARLQEGFIPVTVVLNPSQAVALSRSVTDYYPKPLSSPVLRARSYWFLQETAEPWLLELQSLAEQMEREQQFSRAVSDWIPLLTSADYYARSRALKRIARSPETYRPLIPLLVGLLQETDTHLLTQPADLAQDGLVRMGEAAVDPLIEALSHEAVRVRARAAGTLGQIADPRALDGLNSALTDREPDVRLAAVNALGALKDPRGVSALESMLQDDDANVRTAASQALNAIEHHDALVVFPDEGLDKAVRTAIGKPDGEIRVGDLVGVGFTKLSASNAQIKKLTGLAYCTDLKSVWLGNNKLTDLGPLSGLKKLEQLLLSKNVIEDLGPLAELASLDYLEVSSNPVTSVAPLSGLTGLTHLDLSDTSLTDIAPLSTLNSLERLYARKNQIGDISALSSLGNLKELDLRQNQLADLRPLARLDGLTSISIADNQVSDIEPLAGLDNLKFFIADGNSIADLKPLEHLTQLSILRLSNNPITDIAPVGKLEQLSSLHLARTKAANLSVLSTLTNLARLDVTELDAEGVDFDVLATLTKLKSFNASYNGIANIDFVSNFTGLQHLHLSGNAIDDIAAVAKLEALEGLNLDSNQISDIKPLDGLVQLKHLFLGNNRIVDAEPLANSTMLPRGASVNLRDNPLSNESKDTHIPALTNHGVTVYVDDGH